MSEWVLDLYVEGEPRAQGSMKHVGNGRMVHDPKMVKWRNRVAECLKTASRIQIGPFEPIDEPVEVAVHFWLPRPKKPRLEHAATGLDLDKLQRCIGDALEQSGVLRNDARIVKWLNPEKDWTHDFPGDGNMPGVRIKVRKKQ